MNMIEYLEHAGLSIPQLARVANISIQTLHKIYKGHKPTRKIAERLQVATRGKISADAVSPLPVPIIEQVDIDNNL